MEREGIEKNKIKAVHFLNQFFGGLGGEERADAEVVTKEGPVGPGMVLENALADQGQVVATVICGDNYFNENVEKATDEIIKTVSSYQPDLFFAGPAFGAGRYGVACGHLCRAVQADLGIPAVTGMYHENPGVDLYSSATIIVPTGERVSNLEVSFQAMVRLALKIRAGQALGPASQEGYLPQGIRKNSFDEKTAAERALAMLLAKVRGESFETEIPLPAFESVSPAEPLSDLSSATIALVTTGGIVPKGNPARLAVGRSTTWAKYEIDQLSDLTGESHESIHAGYDASFANVDPDRVVPLDVLRELEKNSIIGRVYPFYYVTSGQGTYVANAKMIGAGIADDLLASSVQGVILTAT